MTLLAEEKPQLRSGRPTPCVNGVVIGVTMGAVELFTEGRAVASLFFSALDELPLQQLQQLRVNHSYHAVFPTERSWSTLNIP